MTICELLVMLKANLEIITEYMDEEAKQSKDKELTLYLMTAEKYITREGIVLNLEEIGDCQLIVMYAAWLYGKRKQTPTSYNGTLGMPRALRLNLNNRLFQQKVNENAT